MKELLQWKRERESVLTIGEVGVLCMYKLETEDCTGHDQHSMLTQVGLSASSLAPPTVHHNYM